ncbi:MAG: hypothetical protein DHS20C21_13880 [Gemmatimonadota bacterium]|nr:MAG: hypothetical protein DHS20C21_13880 [Gemmatimonadota bacterium]
MSAPATELDPPEFWRNFDFGLYYESEAAYTVAADPNGDVWVGMPGRAANAGQWRTMVITPTGETSDRFDLPPVQAIDANGDLRRARRARATSEPTVARTGCRCRGVRRASISQACRA